MPETNEMQEGTRRLIEQAAGDAPLLETIANGLAYRIAELKRDRERLDAILDHSFEVVCKVPGGIQCVEARTDVDCVIAAYAAREEKPDEKS